MTATNSNTTHTDTARKPAKRAPKRPVMPTDSPVLPIAAFAVSLIGLYCGFAVSWMLCVLCGIVAVFLGLTARRKCAPLAGLATAAIVLGALGIVASFALVAVATFQLMSIGLR